MGGGIQQGRQDGLKTAGRAGRKPQLREADLVRVGDLLQKGPEMLAIRDAACGPVARIHLIEREFGIQYHPGHVWKVLDDLGWTCQRPEGRARERNEEAIRHWKRVHWTRH